MFPTLSLRSFVSVTAALIAALLLGGTGPAAAQQISSPAEHIGHEMGAARQLADWEQLLAYYRHLADNSPRVRLDELGPTTLGRRHRGTDDPGHVSGLDLGAAR